MDEEINKNEYVVKVNENIRKELQDLLFFLMYYFCFNIIFFFIEKKKEIWEVVDVIGNKGKGG